MSKNPQKCVILVPVGTHIESKCDESLQVLQQRGYSVRRVRGYAAIDQGRSQMATDALADGFEELMWVDSDVAFDPQDVEKLRGHQLPVCCGVFPKKGTRQMAATMLPGINKLFFGQAGGLHEILYAGFGFVYTRREVYAKIAETLPVCNQMFKRPIVPYFLPLLHESSEGTWYLGEDYAFCERALRCGFKITADTTIRLWHIGNYTYGWEDAGRDVERFGNYSYTSKT
jgi:hypothetical protein